MIPDPLDKNSRLKSSIPASTKEPPEPLSPSYKRSSATNLNLIVEFKLI